jgi:hypothetical protein
MEVKYEESNTDFGCIAGVIEGGYLSGFSF